MAAGVITPDGRACVLADGNRDPAARARRVAGPERARVRDAVRWALELGYRHIDTAQAYGNEESVGQGLRESGVPREEIFLTTKFYPAPPRPGRRGRAQPAAARASTHVDLYIIHWPQGGPTWAWPGMERARELGYARSIGVSNFDVDELDQLRRRRRRSRRSSNQVQFSPFEYRRALLEACERARASCSRPTARSGTGRHLGDATVARDRRAARAHAGAGAAALVRPARHPGDPEVDPPRADRRRTRRSSTSRSPTRTSPSSTRSIAPATRSAHENASGGASAPPHSRSCLGLACGRRP